MNYFLTAVIFSLFAPLYGREKPKGRDELWQAILHYSARVNPGADVPNYPEYSTWRVTGTFSGIEVYKEKVPVKVLNVEGRKSWVAGFIKIGTEVKLSQFRTWGGKYYYLVDPKDVQQTDSLKEDFWVSGLYLMRDESDSFKPQKDFKKSLLQSQRKKR